MAMTTTQGLRQEKAMLMTRAEIYKLEEEMVVWGSSVWMPRYGILLERKW